MLKNGFHFMQDMMMQNVRSSVRQFAALTLLCGALCAVAGCERKEKVLDIETPNGQIEVERSKDTGAVDVEVDRD